MSKAEELAEKAYPQEMDGYCENNAAMRVGFKIGYNQARKELIDKTLDFLKDKLYESSYIGIMDLCDEYIKAMKDE